MLVSFFPSILLLKDVVPHIFFCDLTNIFIPLINVWLATNTLPWDFLTRHVMVLYNIELDFEKAGYVVPRK